ncbi:MAG TPA: SpoIIE family protein phosphatase [Verrucomicrobiae bacterium]|jgi:serine/threonine protein phosphatase PrpC
MSDQLTEWGVAARALPGQTVSGDLHLVKPLNDGVLLAVVDGLGHGEEATVAARIAVGVLDQHAEEPLVPLVLRCHAALMQTRGVVMTVASLRPVEERLTWLGVGNVEAALLRADAQGQPGSERALLRGGLVGYQLPELRASMTTIAPGDLLVFATDGIDAGFLDGFVQSDPPQQIADRILDRHFRGHDDALVLVVRYLGGRHE